jgi:hypothetical protein
MRFKFGRPRNFITIYLSAGLILAALILLVRLVSHSTVRGGPTSTPRPVAILTATPQLTTTTQAALPSEPTSTVVATPTAIPALTSSPVPSPKPLPSLPAPPAGAGSKVGVHGIWANRIPAFTQILANAGAPFKVVKAVDDVSWLKDVKRISPDTVTVGRLTHAHEGAVLVNDPNTDLDGYAGVLMEPILAKVQDDPSLRQAVDYWELTNEPLGGGVPSDAYARLARLTIKCLDIAEANGLKLAIFGFNAGTPEWADLLAIVETRVFARAKAGGHILALHEGVFGDDPVDKWWNVHFVDPDGNPTTTDTGVAAPGGWIPGAPVLEGAGALCLRYRFLYHLLEERDQVVPLFVSEFYAGGGYDAANKADVVLRMHWYDVQLAADDYVLGFAPFTLGPTPDWQHQDYEAFYEGEDGLVAYMIPRSGE